MHPAAEAAATTNPMRSVHACHNFAHAGTKSNIGHYQHLWPFERESNCGSNTSAIVQNAALHDERWLKLTAV
jgi:hypothetical protein